MVENFYEGEYLGQVIVYEGSRVLANPSRCNNLLDSHAHPPAIHETRILTIVPKRGLLIVIRLEI